MTAPELMDKYGLSPKELQSLSKSLKSTKLLGRAAKDGIVPSGREVERSPWTCPSCGKLLPFDQPPREQPGRPEAHTGALSGRVNTWTRKPLVLITSGALAILFLLAAGSLVMKSGLLKGPATIDQGQDDEGEILNRVTDLERQLSQSRQEIEVLKADNTKALGLIENEKKQALNVSKFAEKEREKALAEIRKLEQERDREKNRSMSLDKRFKEEQAKVQQKESILQIRLQDEKRIAGTARRFSDLLYFADRGNAEAQSG